MPISIDFLANVRGFLRGTDDVDEALSQVSSSLDDVARDGARSTDRLADSTERATERMERSFQELADASRREMDNAADASRRSFSRTSASARENLQEVKNEALQNASETFSSFDGSARSFADGVQGTLGGLIASLPAQWAAVGAAGALGLGLLMSGLERSDERTQELRDRVRDLTDDLLEAGGVGTRSIGSIADEVRSLVTESDPAKQNLQRLSDLADELGVSLADALNAYVTGGNGLDDLIENTQRLATAERIRAQELQGFNDLQSAAAWQHADELDGQLQQLREQKQAIEDAQQAELLALRAGVSDFEVKRGLIDAVNKAYDDTAASTQDYIDAESGIFDVNAYITAMQAREKALREYQDNLASSGLTPEAKSFLNEQGADAAAAFLAGYVQATPEQKAELNRIWTEAGRQDSAVYRQTISNEFSGGVSIRGPKVEPYADTDAVRRTLQDFTGQSWTVRLNFVDRNGNQVV